MTGDGSQDGWIDHESFVLSFWIWIPFWELDADGCCCDCGVADARSEIT
jgi:hypothetical protein